ncbi:hypothetical protein FA95DRAFT_1567622 [Auriscalpium vulgare]|uniref:Uncharacterized protein n=1 Tax=Auriscalpium vulgare TaxID=40419 RepID=A0ACB8R3F5_9AGAM|nr:hypothetical protein FA95DRAFT_1567622 [Auriscalpium vulgare]
MFLNAVSTESGKTGMSRYVVCTIQLERNCKESKFEARFTDSVVKLLDIIRRRLLHLKFIRALDGVVGDTDASSAGRVELTADVRTRTIAAARSNAPEQGCLWVPADLRHVLIIREYSWPPRS